MGRGGVGGGKHIRLFRLPQPFPALCSSVQLHLEAALLDEPLLWDGSAAIYSSNDWDSSPALTL